MCRVRGHKAGPGGAPSTEVCRLRPVDGLTQLLTSAPPGDAPMPGSHFQRPPSREGVVPLRVNLPTPELQLAQESL